MSLPNIHIVSQLRARASGRWPKAALLATVVAALSSLSLGSLTTGAHAQATAPPPLTQPDPTYKPLLPNLVTASTGTAAFRYVSSEKQSPLNPYPNGLGDAQNRARGSSDVYWGIADANISWLNTPLARARVEDLGAIGAFSTSTVANGGTISEDYTSLITLDGWSFRVYPARMARFIRRYSRTIRITTAATRLSRSCWFQPPWTARRRRAVFS